MAVTTEMIKQLRVETGAAVLDCKRALEEHDGDLEAAMEYLNAKGLAAAEKKSEREANEGVIEVYSHPGGRVGVLVELNCETDFVANTDKFQALAHDLALHVAFHDPTYVSEEDIPADELEAQKAAYYDEAKASGKPDNVVEKIVEGRLNKWVGEMVLLKQPFVKDEDVLISELVTTAIGELKENIQIRRFARFELGATSDGGDEE